MNALWVRAVGVAALVAGTLDILSAFAVAGIGGVGPVALVPARHWRRERSS